jgi:hypothetical protein
MITSRQINKLFEEWDRTVKDGNKSIDLFLNPTSSDLKEIYSKMSSNNPNKEVRFIANAKAPQKVYMWDAALAVHYAIAYVLGLERGPASFDEPVFVFDGFGYLRGGKVIPVFSHGTAKNIVDTEYARFSGKSKTPPKVIPDWASDYDTLEEFFKYNWNFIDRYVPGVSSYINNERTKFLAWLKR